MRRGNHREPPSPSAIARSFRGTTLPSTETKDRAYTWENLGVRDCTGRPRSAIVSCVPVDQ